MCLERSWRLCSWGLSVHPQAFHFGVLQPMSASTITQKHLMVVTRAACKMCTHKHTHTSHITHGMGKYSHLKAHIRCSLTGFCRLLALVLSFHRAWGNCQSGISELSSRPWGLLPQWLRSPATELEALLLRDFLFSHALSRESEWSWNSKPHSV